MDFIKIDKKFVDLANVDQTAGLIIKTLVGISRELGMKTVAEGIETDSQRERLLALGVEEGQGYLFSPPPSRRRLCRLPSARSHVPTGY